MSLAKGFDDFLRLFQLVPGHPWEQVVLNLIVEPTIQEIIDEAGLDVSGGEYLSPQEVHLRVGVEQKHALVVRGKGRASVKSEDELIDDEEHDGMPETQPYTQLDVKHKR